MGPPVRFPMSRFTIFASVIPLILAALFGHADPVPQMRPCITIGEIGRAHV